MTAFDQAHPAVLLLKSIAPFWGTFDDLLSGDQKRMVEGRQGLVFDLLFFLPVARFVGGAVRILKTAGKLGFKPALPRLGRLTRTLLVALAQEFNPADGLSQLLKWGRIKVLMGGRSLASRGLEHFKQAARRSSVARYDTRRGLVTVDDPALWKSPPPGDQLRRVNGIDNVAVRNTAARMPHVTTCSILFPACPMGRSWHRGCGLCASTSKGMSCPPALTCLMAITGCESATLTTRRNCSAAG